MARLRRLLNRLLAVLLGLVGSLLLVELVLRLGPFDLPEGVRAHVSIHAGRHVVQDHPTLGWCLVPGLQGLPVPSADYDLFHVSTTPAGEGDAGFRGPHDRDPLVAVVGDSFVFGFGVEQPESLPAALGEQLGAPCANFGVYGYGPQQTLEVLRRYALPRQPKVALWVWFENDLNDAHSFAQDPPRGLDQGPRQPGHPAEAAPRAEAQDPRGSDWHNTYWAGFKFWRYRSPYLSSRREHLRQGPIETILHYNPFGELDLERPEIQGGLESTRQCLEAFRQDCEAAGVLPLLALMPFKESVYVDEFREVARRPADFDLLDSTRRRVRELGEDLGLATLDLAPSLREHRQEPLFQVADAHLSAHGNRRVAQWLEPWVRQQLAAWEAR